MKVYGIFYLWVIVGCLVMCEDLLEVGWIGKF